MRIFSLVTCLLVSAGAARAAPDTALLHPLAVTPSPSLTEPVEALQRRFLSIARERCGYELLLRKEVEGAIKSVGRKDYARSDDALAQLATAAKVEFALYVSFELTPANELVLEGRVVRRGGERVKVARLSTPRGGGSLLDALGSATERFFEQLNRPPAVAVTPPVVVALPEPPPPPPSPEPVVAAPPVVQQPAPSASPLRTIGFVSLGVGAAAAIAGGVVFATAGTVQRDANGNIAVGDAAKVAGIRGQQGAGIGLLAGGGAVAIAGAVLALTAPRAPVTAALAPRTDGALLVLSGNF